MLGMFFFFVYLNSMERARVARKQASFWDIFVSVTKKKKQPQQSTIAYTKIAQTFFGGKRSLKIKITVMELNLFGNCYNILIPQIILDASWPDLLVSSLSLAITSRLN